MSSALEDLRALQKETANYPVCGKKIYGWKCKLPKGHNGDCDYHEPKDRLLSIIEKLEREQGPRAVADAIEQCAIEAGERSPEGVSSHTMLGDMWDERILKLRALASSEGVTDSQQSPPK